MRQLIGHTIRKITLDPDGYYLTFVSDTHELVYRSMGDCCAHAYILPLEATDIAYFLGQTVISVTESDVTSKDDNECEVIDTCFYTVKSQFADLDLELRTEHNGYYGGWIEFVSANEL